MHLRSAAFAAYAWVGAVTIAAVTTLFWLLAHQAGAVAPCSVPTINHPTIQEAVADPICDQIILTAPAYTENVVITRSLRVSGSGPAATVVDGGEIDSVFAITPGLAVTLTGFTISGGYAAEGGAIYNNASHLLISDTVVAGNSVLPLGRGGGIYNQVGGQLTVRHSTLQGNNGGQAGGAIYSAGDLLLVDTTIFSNTAQGGGGLRLALGSTAIISNTVFDGNLSSVAYGRGGAILTSGSLTLTASTLVGNRASNTGGRGGALFVDAAPLHAAGNLIFANHAAEGGAFYASNALLVLDDSILASNDATGSGGALAAGDSAVSLNNARLEQNAASLGGAMHLTGGVLSVYSSTLTANSAGSSGGAIHATASVTITASTFSYNSAVQSGGAVWSAGLLLLRNSTVSSNTAVSGAGLLTFDTATFESSTIVHNNGSVGGGIGGSGNQFTLHNSIIAANSGGDCLRVGGATIVSQGYNLDGDGSCSLFKPGDQRRVDPLLGPLADNGGPTQTHALLQVSSAVDAGDPASCPSRDQRGVPRPVDGNGGIAICDIGAFEYDGPPAHTIAAPLVQRP